MVRNGDVVLVAAHAALSTIVVTCWFIRHLKSILCLHDSGKVGNTSIYLSIYKTHKQISARARHVSITFGDITLLLCLKPLLA